MPIIINPESRDHWLQMKAEDVSSTESSALFGISKYSTEFELWHQKKSGEVIEFQDNERMFIGREIENKIADMISIQMNMKVRRLKTYYRHDDEKRMSSSFDYEIVGDYSKSELMKMNPHLKGAGLLEIKNVDGFIYREDWIDDEAPPHIEAQVQHQMEVANRNWTLIVALVGGNKLVTILRERDRNVGKAIRNRITRFFMSIDNDIEPMPNFERDAAFINGMYTSIDDKGEPMDITAEENILAMVITYKELNARKLGLEKALDSIRAEVLHSVGNVPRLTTSDGLTVNMTMTKGTLPTTVTEEMVGTEIGGRAAYRQFRITKRKVK